MISIHAAGNGIADGNEIRPLPIADGNGQTAIDGNGIPKMGQNSRQNQKNM